MPIWSETLNEIIHAQVTHGGQAFDHVRKKYIALASQLTGRATIVYGSKWTPGDRNVPAELVSIHDGDLQGLMEVVNAVPETALDLVLHSPGGGIDAAAAVVEYLRSKFTDIRVIVPSLAMSAAGMVACAGNCIVMGKHSFLGPSDPQLVLPTPLGPRQVAAQSVVAQFKRAQQECLENPANLAVWAPILNQYGPDLLIHAEHATKLSRSYVERWLKAYMFSGDEGRDQRAHDIATWLSSHENFNSHGTHISREELRKRGLKISNLEDNPAEQDVFLTIFHALTLTFQSTPVLKIIENHRGRAFINFQQMVMQPPGLQIPGAPQMPQPVPPAGIQFGGGAAI